MTHTLSPQHAVDLLGALADVVLVEDLATGAITTIVEHGLPHDLRSRRGGALYRAWARRLAAADRARVVRGLREALRSGQGSWLERYAIHGDGGALASVIHRVVRFEHTAYHLVQDASVATEMVRTHEANHREISAMVSERTRALTETNAALARALAHKDQFLASMSHELRTPLNTIVGLTEALADGLAGPLTDKQRHWLGEVVEGAHHLLGLINDLLDLARVDAGKFEPEWQPVAPGDLAVSAVRLVAGAALARRIAIIPEVAPDLPPILTDPRAARQILVNLIGNAVKFSADGSQVRVRVGVGSVAGTTCFEVIDTGVGIPADRLPEIFQPFVQLDGTRERTQGGTGLGLALVARMVELLGGAITVESELGRGSTFRLTLGVSADFAASARRTAPPADEVGHPAEGRTPAGADAAERPIPALRPGLKVLIADDNEANVRIFKSFLESRGCRVEVAHDGQAAVEATERWEPEIVLMDVQMPRMDGLQATRLIRERSRFAALPIIAVTAVAMPGDRERCLAAGMTTYLAKPVRLRELQETIAVMTASHA